MEIEKKEHRRLRNEHSRRIESGYYAEHLGVRCVNCGSEELVTYHHIVPISVGGTNSLGNIVCVCRKCHKAIHGNRDRSLYDNKVASGRPRTASEEEWEEVLNEYSECRIGYKEAMERLRRKIGAHLVDSRYYKDYCKAHGIKKIRNLVDTYRTYGRLNDGEYVGYILYENGLKEEKVYAE